MLLLEVLLWLREQLGLELCQRHCLRHLQGRRARAHCIRGRRQNVIALRRLRRAVGQRNFSPHRLEASQRLLLLLLLLLLLVHEARVGGFKVKVLAWVGERKVRRSFVVDASVTHTSGLRRAKRLIVEIVQVNGLFAWGVAREPTVVRGDRRVKPKEAVLVHGRRNCQFFFHWSDGVVVLPTVERP